MSTPPIVVSLLSSDEEDEEEKVLARTAVVAAPYVSSTSSSQNHAKTTQHNCCPCGGIFRVQQYTITNPDNPFGDPLITYSKPRCQTCGMENTVATAPPVVPKSSGDVAAFVAPALHHANKALVPWNQPLVERLLEMLSKLPSTEDKRIYPYRNVLKSVLKCPIEIRSQKDLRNLHGVGDFMFRHLVKTLFQMTGEDAIAATTTVDSIVSPSMATGKSKKRPHTMNRTKSGGDTVSAPKRSRPKKTSSSAMPTIPTSSSSSLPSETAEATTSSIPTNFAQSKWNVMLLMDNREVGSASERNFFNNKFLQAGIKFEKRGIPLGDYQWVAYNEEGKEFVMDVIIERKTVDDLACSIKDGRYSEQKARLLSSKLSRPMYILEGDIAKQTGLPGQTGAAALTTAIYETRIHAGICVKHTANREDTVKFILQVHDILQRNCMTYRGWQCEDRAWDKFKRSVTKYSLQSVGDVFQYMLKQVPGCGSEAAIQISQSYPTPMALEKAYFYERDPYQDLAKEKTRRQSLLSTIKVGKKQIGPALSGRMAKMFCQLDYVVKNTAADAQSEDGKEDDAMQGNNATSSSSQVAWSQCDDDDEEAEVVSVQDDDDDEEVVCVA